jgi:hypothetical protein
MNTPNNFVAVRDLNDLKTKKGIQMIFREPTKPNSDLGEYQEYIDTPNRSGYITVTFKKGPFPTIKLEIPIAKISTLYYDSSKPPQTPSQEQGPGPGPGPGSVQGPEPGQELKNIPTIASAPVPPSVQGSVPVSVSPGPGPGPGKGPEQELKNIPTTASATAIKSESDLPTADSIPNSNVPPPIIANNVTASAESGPPLQNSENQPTMAEKPVSVPQDNNNLPTVADAKVLEKSETPTPIAKAKEDPKSEVNAESVQQVNDNEIVP